MQVTMIKNNRIFSILLPEKVQGKYWLKSYENGRLYKIISLEAYNGSWQLNTEKYSCVIMKKGEKLQKVAFDPHEMYRVIAAHDNGKCLVYAENFDENSSIFKKYRLKKDNGLTISIGRENCDICYKNEYVSENHASLMYYESNWSVIDCESTNGTYVNNHAINHCSLVPGDVIYIMGLIIIIGENFLAINRKNDIKLNRDIFQEIALPELKENADLDFYEEDPEYFYRLPRFKKNVSTEKITVDAVPKPQTGNEMPFILTLGPSVTMGMASAATCAFSITTAIQNGNIKAAFPSMIMSCSMLLGTMVWPFITKRYEKKISDKKEAVRQEKYNEYLDEKKSEISKLAERQKKILEENVVSVTDCVKMVLASDKSLWERNMSQDDFLKFRVGIGDLPVDAEFTFPEEKFSVDEDLLSEKTAKLRDMPKKIHDAPITMSLFDNIVTSVYGDRERLLSFAKGILAQNTYFYGYDDVKIVLLFDKYESDKLDHLKWLPHVWNNDRSMRYIINDSDDLRELSSFFRVMIENRSNLDDNQREKVLPYYMIYVFSRDLFLRADFLRDILESEKKLNISVITFFNDFSEVPKESTQVIALDHDKGKLFDKNDTSGSTTDFKCDVYYHEILTEYCKKLANINLDIGSDYSLPPVITFLELFGAGRIEHLNVLEKWKDNDPTKTLKTEVGFDTYGDKFYIDLHEKYHGPHGLVAGMTGSGKSEFIMTFILSLAVNYHPHEVSFVLIDYKGGGMAKSFENLPHTAGIITNLDGSSIKRSLVSIESELKRRQATFTEAAKKLGISNIDIYKYQKAYRNGQVNKPLSHVFIIADEFAELKSQQPEFMTQLISAARIGRSLGVHLILATQKPSGVVDDQIWSNSKFRVCLKVQDRADSMDMLKRPDAAALKETGRFYLQVGYNELFMMGQSAWAGAQYIPSDSTEKDDDIEISVVNMTGREIVRSKLDNKRNAVSDHKQLDIITSYLSDVAKSENVHAEYLSLPPLPKFLLYSDIAEKYPAKGSERYDLTALVGEIDDPARQRKLPLYVDFSGEGNVILYGVDGSGKENFIMMLLYDIICRHKSDEFNSYIIDLGSEVLKTYEAAPHIGGVAVTGEDELIENLFKMLKEMFLERRKQFAEYGGSLTSYCKETGNIVSNQLIIINNYEAFTEIYDRFSDDVQFLTREGRRYGIYFLLSCAGSNAVRFKLLQNFKQIFVLQQNDISDYSGILGNTGGVYPAGFKGRGIIKVEETFEFQTALPAEEDSLKTEITMLCSAICETGMHKAKKIPILPERIDMEFLSDIDKGFDRFPYGVYKEDLSIAYLDLSRKPFICIGANEIEKTVFFTRSLLILGRNMGIDIMDITDTDNSLGSEDCERFVVDLYTAITGRHKKKKSDSSISFANMIVFICGFINVYDKLSEDGKSKLEILLSQNLSSYSCSLMISDGINNLKKISSKGWYSKAFGDKGIWIGTGLSQQYVFNTNGLVRGISIPADDFGFDLTKEKCRLVKLLNGDVING